MRQPFCAMGVYQPKSLPHYGKRRQFNEIVTLHRMKRLPRRLGYIIYTIQGAPTNNGTERAISQWRIRSQSVIFFINLTLIINFVKLNIDTN